MIEHLHIQNVALIACADVTFQAGLNVISGETGSGKSMLIAAISFVLGGRAGKDFIRHGEEAASVDILMRVKNPEARRTAAEAGVTFGEDGGLVLSRTLTAGGRSVCRMNGRIVTAGMMREIAELLLDFHSQHEHQSLMSHARQADLVDQFIGEPMNRAKLELSEHIRLYKATVKKLDGMIADEGLRARKTEELTFAISEIDAARLKTGEEEALLARAKTLSHLERLAENSAAALALLSEREEDNLSATAQVGRAFSLLAEMAKLDAAAQNMADGAADILTQLADVTADLKAYAQRLELDPGERAGVEARLDMLYGLKRKYGKTIDDILAYGEQARRELSDMAGGAELAASLKQDKKRRLTDISACCGRMSELREKAARSIEGQISAVLRELGMKDAMFSVLVERKKEFGANGNNRVEFLIAPNMGEPPKPLAQIASGGEMSRVMLALKTVLADADRIETFIFDEIDAGVSGRTAQKVGEKLRFLSGGHQILCITHLPQIAAMADNHIFIEKKIKGERTLTTITTLNHDGSVAELARLIGGAKTTAASMAAAAELKALAAKANQ